MPMTTQLHLRERKSRFIRILYPEPPHTVCPNMFVLAHAAGCLFEPQCSYCYLKSTFGYLCGHEAFTNFEQMEREIRRWIARDALPTYMLNAGTMCDPFSFEGVRPVAARLVEIFREAARGRPHTLLFVTKGGRRHLQSLFETEPCENVIISFSVTHPEAAARYEQGAATVNDRLETAAALKARGWRLRMRVDPMFRGYEHGEVAQRVKALQPERVTLGTLRADPDLLRYVRDGTFEELQRTPDGKRMARYPLEERLALYRQVIEIIKGQCPVALCEEEEAAWDALGLDKASRPCNCQTAGWRD